MEMPGLTLLRTIRDVMKKTIAVGDRAEQRIQSDSEGLWPSYAPPPPPPGSLMALVERLPVPSQCLRQDLNALIRCDSFRPLYDALSKWPERSTVPASERIALLWLASNSREMLEIGTWWAGTTELMAWAAHRHGSAVHTIDPQGGDRAPYILESWPPELAARVTFHARSSSEYFSNDQVPAFDLVFIDGSHTYPNVYHDIAASIEAANRRGYFVIDNTNQPAVLEAVHDYVSLHPSVEAVLVGDRSRDEVYVTDVASEADSAFAVLRVNKATLVGGRTYNYHVSGLPAAALGQLVVSFEGQSPGPISVDVHLRATPYDQNHSAEMIDIAERRVFPASHGPITWTPSLQLPPMAVDHLRTAEISLRVDAPFDAMIRSGRLSLSGMELDWGSVNRDFVLIENRYQRIDELYQAGLQALTRDNEEGRREAERCFALLTAHAPRFGEAFFQAARLAEKRGDTARAAQLMGEAVRLTPDHALYKSEFETLRSRLGTESAGTR
jgi:predicted O-methyltransferase YrrM